MDEPTSALDTASTVALKAYLNEIKHDKIIIVITHDRDFVNNKDDVVIQVDSKSSTKMTAPSQI